MGHFAYLCLFGFSPQPQELVEQVVVLAARDGRVWWGLTWGPTLRDPTLDYVALATYRHGPFRSGGRGKAARVGLERSNSRRINPNGEVDNGVSRAFGRVLRNVAEAGLKCRGLRLRLCLRLCLRLGLCWRCRRPGLVGVGSVGSRQYSWANLRGYGGRGICAASPSHSLTRRGEYHRRGPAPSKSLVC